MLQPAGEFNWFNEQNILERAQRAYRTAEGTSEKECKEKRQQKEDEKQKRNCVVRIENSQRNILKGTHKKTNT